MTERLGDISARIDGIHQLGAVVNAMRGIAAARAQQARGQLVAVDGYAATIAREIGRVLALIPSERSDAPGKSAKPALVLFCAEQGFAGAFSERVLNSVGTDLSTSQLFLIGSRGSVAIAERGVATVWKAAMPSRSLGIPKLADSITDALHAHIAKGAIDRLDVVFSHWEAGHGAQVERRKLLPFDTTAFPLPDDDNPPLLNLNPDVLLRALTEDYLFAQLCKAGLHAFAAENEARMQAMAAARNQIEQRLSTLEATKRLVRQEEITAEVIELAAGETATR